MNRKTRSCSHSPAQRLARTPVAAACVATLLLAAGAAQAQTSDAPPTNLGVVEVTGQSRVQQLQDVPISMRAIGADTLKAVAATNMASLDGLVPGLVVEASQATQPDYSLRGLQAYDFGIGTDSPVGLYLNGVYAGKTGGALLSFNDVKRVEVLKGPQGTLFGRNAAGGAISIITNDPKNAREASGLVRIGNQGQYHAEAIYNDTVGEGVAFRFSGVREHKDGWQTNTFDGSKFGGDNGWGTRMSVKFSGEETTALLSWEHETMDQKARAIYSLPPKPGFPVSPANWRNPLDLPLAEDANPNREARKFDGVTLRVTHSLPFAELTSITAYRHFNAQNVQDNDGSAVISSYFSTGNYERNTTWQQEFKLNGSNDNFDWVAGVSAYAEKATQQTALNTNARTLDTVFGGASGGLLTPFAATSQLAAMFGVPGVDFTGSNMTWQESMFNTGKYSAAAAYGDVIWKLTKDTNLTTGVRFTRDSKTFTWNNPVRTATAIDATVGALAQGGFYQGVNANQAAVAASMGLTNAQLQAALVGAGLSPNLGDDLYYLSTTNVNFNSPEATTEVLKRKASWNNTSPRLVIDHHVDKDTMLFASVTRGYQAGGFNAIYKEGVSTFTPETVTSYEAGIKGSFKSAGLFYSASLFHYDFNNLQSIGTSKSSSGVTTYVVTVSDQKATGADLEAYWQLNPTWRLNAATELINQTYKKYSYAPDPTTVINMAGEPTGTPRVTATLGADARFALLGGQGSATLNWAYVGQTRCNSESTARFTCGSFPAFSVGESNQRFDLRLGWDAPSRKWGVALVSTNVLNNQHVGYISVLGSTVGSPTAWVTPPRSVALEFSARM